MNLNPARLDLTFWTSDICPADTVRPEVIAMTRWLLEEDRHHNIDHLTSAECQILEPNSFPIGVIEKQIDYFAAEKNVGRRDQLKSLFISAHKPGYFLVVSIESVVDFNMDLHVRVALRQREDGIVYGRTYRTFPIAEAPILVEELRRRGDFYFYYMNEEYYLQQQIEQLRLICCPEVPSRMGGNPDQPIANDSSIPTIPLQIDMPW